MSGAELSRGRRAWGKMASTVVALTVVAMTVSEPEPKLVVGEELAQQAGRVGGSKRNLSICMSTTVSAGGRSDRVDRSH